MARSDRPPGTPSQIARWARAARRRARAILNPFTAPIFYDPLYRLPLPSASVPAGLELRRPDYVAWYLLEGLRVSPECFHRPSSIGFRALLGAHSARLVESLTDAKTLAEVFAVDASEVSVDDVLKTLRAACGGTAAAARLALRQQRAALNLLGGFHHAGRDRLGPLCAANDIAIATWVVRQDGFDGRIAILDLDAHPPDGTADCFAGDEAVWIGSLSGADWGALPGAVDETVLPHGTGDAAYLQALDALLERMPAADLTFVLAGADVLAGDKLGTLALTPEGIRERDRRVFARLRDRASVWLPAGGYSPGAWRITAATALVLSDRADESIDPSFDPLEVHFARIQAKIGPDDLTDDELTLEDLGLDLGRSGAPGKLLGYWTVSGVELALTRYGILEQLRRLGYRELRVAFDRATVGERIRVTGRSLGVEHLLIELVVEVRRVADRRVLFLHWLSMQNPRAKFTDERPRLPGQESPGLGLGREAAFLLAGMAKRLDLAGAAFRPSWYHMAYAARHSCRFVDPSRQGRFEALVRDLEGMPLLEATHRVASGGVLLSGKPYQWEADDMVMGLDLGSEDRPAIDGERNRARFVLDPSWTAPAR